MSALVFRHLVAVASSQQRLTKARAGDEPGGDAAASACAGGTAQEARGASGLPDPPAEAEARLPAVAPGTPAPQSKCCEQQQRAACAGSLNDGGPGAAAAPAAAGAGAGGEGAHGTSPAASRPVIAWSRCRAAAARIGRGLSGGGGAQSALMLQCEHWLECADPKHRYGTNLRPYFEHWLEALREQERRQEEAARLRQQRRQQQQQQPARESINSGPPGGGHGDGVARAASAPVPIPMRRSHSAPRLKGVRGVWEEDGAPNPGTPPLFSQPLRAAAAAAAGGDWPAAAAAAPSSGPAAPAPRRGAAPRRLARVSAPCRAFCRAASEGGAGGGAAKCAPAAAAAPRAEPPPAPRAAAPRTHADARFFYWLDEGCGRQLDLAHQGVPRAKLERERVQYLSEAELDRLEVCVDAPRGGLLVYKAGGALVDTGHELRLVQAGGSGGCGGGGGCSGEGAAAAVGSGAPGAPPAASATAVGFVAPAPHPASSQQQQEQQQQQQHHHHLHHQQQHQQEKEPEQHQAQPQQPHSPGAAASKPHKRKTKSSGFELDALWLLQLQEDGLQPPGGAAAAAAPGAAPAGACAAAAGAADAAACSVGTCPAPGAAPAAPAPAAAAAGAATAQPELGPGGVAAAAGAGVLAPPAREGLLQYEAKPAKWIYVLDTSGRLFIHAKHRGSFHHSSFLRGGAVLSAGGIVVSRGRILKLTADSGHYRPDFGSLMGMVKLLRGWGADLSATKLSAKHIDCPL